jgi:hypothetical protein
MNKSRCNKSGISRHWLTNPRIARPLTYAMVVKKIIGVMKINCSDNFIYHSEILHEYA